MITAFARSRVAATSADGDAASSGVSHQVKSAWIVRSTGASASRTSCRRTASPPVGGTTGSAVPGSASRAQRSARAMSADRSPERVCTCMPSRTSPFGRTRAADAPGSTVATVACCPSRVGSGAVADGRNSRIATSSHSAARPANGRVTITSSPAPWQAL